MNYLAFLKWILANVDKIEALLNKLAEIVDLFAPAATDESGVLSIAQAAVVDSTFVVGTVSEEEEALEGQIVAALHSDDPAQPLAAFDGSRIRKLFETLGPLLQNLPAIIALLKSLSGK